MGLPYLMDSTREGSLIISPAMDRMHSMYLRSNSGGSALRRALPAGILVPRMSTFPKSRFRSCSKSAIV